MNLSETRQLADALQSSSQKLHLMPPPAMYCHVTAITVTAITVSHTQCWQLWDSTLPVLNSLYLQ